MKSHGRKKISTQLERDRIRFQKKEAKKNRKPKEVT
jgi:hypothetical protein